MEKQKVKEILDYLVEHFRTNPRAVIINSQGNTTCTYLSPEGLRCGHSIFLKDEMVEKFDNPKGSAEHVIRTFGDGVHKEPYQGMPIHFWESIQLLHDYHHYWVKNDTGGVDLTNRGNDFFNYILNKEWENQYSKKQ